MKREHSVWSVKLVLVLVTALAWVPGACGDDPQPDGDADADQDSDDDSPDDEDQATILRDEYGVPHIYAGSMAAAAYAWGYVHAEDSRLLVLQNMYAGEGQCAEVFGAACVEIDFLIRIWEITDLVAAQYDSLRPETRAVLEAYAAGINAFFEQLDPTPAEFVRPVTGQSVAGVIMGFRVDQAMLHSLLEDHWQLIGDGSNQFAATGAATIGETTYVSIDPHTAWGASQPTIHVHFDDYDIVGLSKTMPVVHCGGNNFIHWGCTALFAATAVMVESELSGDGSSYYDHRESGFVELDVEEIHIDVDGVPEGETREVLYTRFGPAELGPDEEYVYSSHIFSVNDITYVDYAVGAWSSRGIDDYVALFAGPTPGETALNRAFGSEDGRVGYIYAAYVPVLNADLDWSEPVSSADPSIEWEPEQWFNIDDTPPELPHIIDPVGDFVQNCNDRPGQATWPTDQITGVPTYINQGGTTERGNRMLTLLSESEGIDAAEAMAISTNIWVPRGRNGIEALRRGLDAESIDDPIATFGADAGELMNILLAWNDFNGYLATTDSEAMTVLFLYDHFAEPASYPGPDDTLSLASINAFATALTDLAGRMQTAYADLADPLHVPWGYVNHAVVGGVDVPMPGGTKTLQALFMSWSKTLNANGRFVADRGSHYMQVAELGPAGLDVYLTVPNGQVNHLLFPGSPHIGQTIDDFAGLTYRRVWLDRSEVEDHLCPHGGDPGHEHLAQTDLIMPE